jgi:hypothetical protein
MGWSFPAQNLMLDRRSNFSSVKEPISFGFEKAIPQAGETRHIHPLQSLPKEGHETGNCRPADINQCIKGLFAARKAKRRAHNQSNEETR